ncbi:MAG TPA: SRPBCC family protein [Solirubrobacteraceae bacterium]
MLRHRTLPASQQELWELISDAHHMPRWWPGVARMEEVTAERFTQVFKTKKGRPVRADFHVVQSEPPWLLAFEQEIPGTPFERVLNELVVEIRLEAVAAGGTEVTIAQAQKLRGYSRTGGFLVRGATKRRLDDALDGLARITSPAGGG